MSPRSGSTLPGTVEKLQRIDPPIYIPSTGDPAGVRRLHFVMATRSDGEFVTKCPVASDVFCFWTDIPSEEEFMPVRDKSSYSNKQKRQAEHIEEGYEKLRLGQKGVGAVLGHGEQEHARRQAKRLGPRTLRGSFVLSQGRTPRRPCIGVAAGQRRRASARKAARHVPVLKLSREHSHRPDPGGRGRRGRVGTPVALANHVANHRCLIRNPA